MTDSRSVDLELLFFLLGLEMTLISLLSNVPMISALEMSVSIPFV